ncbi:hypothetical protein ACKW6Q_06425 [Chryseobacterium kwangjuense]|uniref:Lipoprotein n=1 Tax=Chryseobacterium kwangjuense TaxID=267125 RepID=A0ABW9K3B0_9FLAO
MMKKLALRLALLAAVAFSLQSCRTEEDLLQNPQETEKRFQAFTSRNGEPINYPRGYKLLLEKYDSIYSTAYTSKTFFKNSILGKSGLEEYVELNIRSQELMMKNNTERWILYPVVKEKEVIGIEVGILKNNESRLEFWRMDPQDDYYKEIIGSFRVAYSEKILTQQTMNKGGNCGRPGEEPCDTGEVVITIPKPNGPKANPHLYLPGANPGSGDPGVIGGNCGAYGNCGGGGNGPYQDNQDDDPCKNLKKQHLNKAHKEKIDALDKPSVLSLKKETGYAESKSGVFTPLPQSASTDLSDGLTITVTANTKGYMHTHLNDYDTGTVNDDGLAIIKEPIRMFSPADVNTLMTMAGFVTDGDYSQLYGTMISSYGNYTIKFTGAASDIKTGFDTEQWRTDYMNYRKENKYWSFEKLFLNFLKYNMNVQGVELYKIKNNGIIQKKTLKSNNNVQTDDCPKL